MPKLLFHTYHFPPIGGSGAQRPLKMVRYLSELGYPSLVVTSGGATSDRWAPEDVTLAEEIPADVEIQRVPNDDEPALSTGLRRAAERWGAVPDRWATWWARESHRLGRSVGDGVDLIYVWMQPYASADAGATLSRELGRPWVADLGDPWALDEMMIFPSAVHRRRALKKMRDVLSTAAAIVMSTEEAVSRLLAEFPELGDRPVVAIPNGFDAADFVEAPPPRGDDTFRIVHTGYLHTEIGLQHRRRRRLRESLRASPHGLDILTRSHVFVVDALRRLLAREPELAGRIELHLAGVLNASDQAVVDGVSFVRQHGYVAHAESIGLMQTADLLFLPMQNLPPGVRATIVPGKTYEYLASRTPILAAVPDGDARDILSAAGNALLVRPDDVDGLASAIRNAFAAREAGMGRAAPADEVVARYEYSKLARELADVFDRVLGRTDSARAA
jgi:glycosyltransferase involved in cell wall biosynthesis